MLSALMPGSASTQGATTDAIFFTLLGLSAVIILLVLTLVITFAIRYRRGSKADRGPLPAIISRQFELGWTATTLFAFLFLFWWAGSSELSALIPPKDALEVHVVAKQWMWKTQHANGAREINELHAPVGVPVRLVMTSQDVIHSFFIPAFRIKKDVLPGRYTDTWFEADKVGVYHLFCAEFCGTDHSRMLGRIVIMTPEDYAQWLTSQPEGDDLAREGAALFTARGCSGCHAPSSPVHAPKLVGLYGRAVALSDGRTVTADEAYIRDSILLPRRDIVAGYDPIMPSFAGILSDGEIQSLIAYIRSLASPPERSVQPGGAWSGSLVPGTPSERSPAMTPGNAVNRQPPGEFDGGKP
ncbi:cytochrome c oxidase subunit II [Microvirga sp. M2]|uniref:cytochrome c oxidase subunit II n=1 Tax=Microvirga sp. M2 TaxID=3073270 RepID=UPI0039C2C58B